MSRSKRTATNTNRWIPRVYPRRSQTEIDHLGISRSPAVHYEPETNGCAEKAIQTLKEQVLWIERFETLEQLRAAVRAFGRAYNAEWLIERHSFRTPIEAREHLIRQAAMA